MWMWIIWVRDSPPPPSCLQLKYISLCQWKHKYSLKLHLKDQEMHRTTHVRVHAHNSVRKIRSRSGTVEWQHVLTTSDLNGPCFPLMCKTSPSVYFWHFLSQHYLFERSYLTSAKPKVCWCNLRSHAAAEHVMFAERWSQVQNLDIIQMKTKHANMHT